MTPSTDRSGGDETSSPERSGVEAPDVGLVADEDLPEDLQPTEDNPLARDPDGEEEGRDGDTAPQAGGGGGMPDAGRPGP